MRSVSSEFTCLHYAFTHSVCAGCVGIDLCPTRLTINLLSDLFYNSL